MKQRRTLIAVIAVSLLLLASLATAALASGVGRGPDSADFLEPNLVLYTVETNAAFFDACPFVSEEETPEERDVRCAEEAEQPQDGDEDGELPDPWVGVLDTIAIDEETYFDEARENLAGVNKILCTQHFTFTIVCQGTLALHDGNLFWSAYVDFTALEGEEGQTAEATPAPTEGQPETPFTTAAITGGTGAYLGAEGHVDLFETSEPDAEETLGRYEIHVVR